MVINDDVFSRGPSTDEALSAATERATHRQLDRLYQQESNELAERRSLEQRLTSAMGLVLVAAGLAANAIGGPVTVELAVAGAASIVALILMLHPLIGLHTTLDESSIVRTVLLAIRGDVAARIVIEPVAPSPTDLEALRGRVTKLAKANHAARVEIRMAHAFLLVAFVFALASALAG